MPISGGVVLRSILLVAPSDHNIPDTDAFHSTISRGLDAILNGKIVTFGIIPNRPETGYGYLELSKPTSEEAVDLVKFVEKPDASHAHSMLEAGNYLWNAGIFLFRACDMIKAFEHHTPELIGHVRASLEGGTSDLDFWRLEPSAW